MGTNRASIAETAAEIGFLITNKFKIFSKQSKPTSKEVIELQLSDDVPKPIFKKGKKPEFKSMEEIDKAFEEASEKRGPRWK